MMKKYKEKILLVDDDSKNLQVAMSILKEYNVIFAQSGEKALELVKQNDFDLILLDIVMPNMDGYSICKILKEDEKTQKIPVIFLTVKDNEEDIVKGFEYGAVDYVVKPFYSEVLLKRVKLHIKLTNAIKELKNVNSNLNEIVAKQVDEIRQKDEIIAKQSKIDAMANVIEIVSLQWSVPLNKLKLYLQSMKFKNFDEETTLVFENSLKEVNQIDTVMDNFNKFFNNKKNREIVNLKVVLDSVLFNLSETIKQNDIFIEVKGDNLVSLNIIYNEIKHIFVKLLECSIKKASKEIEQKSVNILIEKKESIISIVYEDKTSVYDESDYKIFDLSNEIDQETFDLGFYLVKIFIEKNKGTLKIEKIEQGTKYIINFKV